MFPGKLVVIDIEQMSYILTKVIRVFTGEAGGSPIVLKRPNVLQSEPFQLTARMPSKTLWRCVGVTLIAGQENTILKNGFLGRQNSSDNFGIQVTGSTGIRARGGRVLVRGGGIKGRRKHVSDGGRAWLYCRLAKKGGRPAR
jgi:hypothetical protein